MTDRQHQYPQSFLDDEAFAELEKAGNVRLTPELRDELAGAILKCILVRDWNEAYSPDAIEGRDTVALQARKLKEALNALGAASYLSVLLGDDQGELHFKTPELSDADPDQFIEQLDAIIMRSELRAPEGFIRRDGRPRDTHIERLCEIAADVFERAGGRAAIGGKRQGPFARFIHCLNNYIPRGYRAASGDALAKQAQEAIKRRNDRAERPARSKLRGPLKSAQTARLN